ncbi:unnamed protein product [Polarella glacialis]|uniref:Uncharacterized protein n=1 Tax=Polarella glacialis TaxID=89957 RepID=A0A813JLE5_POLGL|nr:unnamed protein product [Polarella glacialis]
MDFFRPHQINSLLVPWKIPAGAKPEEALAEPLQGEATAASAARNQRNYEEPRLRKLIQDYPPGQDGVDAGGFRLVEAKPTYLYAQFANSIALISDVEFAVRQDGTVLLRSAARSMSADPFGVVRTPPDGLASAKRLNYFASRLRQVGWTAPYITRETHPEYFKDNVDTSPGFTFQRKPGQGLILKLCLYFPPVLLSDVCSFWYLPRFANVADIVLFDFDFALRMIRVPTAVCEYHFHLATYKGTSGWVNSTRST